MSRRQAMLGNRAKLARDRKGDRWALVHGAGCVFEICSDWFFDHTVVTPGTRIPRSLRKLFGYAVAP